MVTLLLQSRKGRYRSGGTNPAKKTVLDSRYGEGVAFSLTNQVSYSTWASDFETLVSKQTRIPPNEYSKAVVVIKVTSRKNQTRIMSIAFGYGESLLDSAKYENDFGRNIAAQKIPDSGVLSAGTIQISDAIIQMEKQYAGTRNGGIQQLVTSQSEFPNSISGTWRNGKIETKLEGRGALLKAKRLMNLEDLVNDLKVYLETYLDPSDMSDWATRLTQIRTGDLKNQLDNELMAGIITDNVEYGIAWSDYRMVDDLSTDLLKRIPNVSPVNQIKWYIQKQVKKNQNYNALQLLKKIKTSKLIAVDDAGVEVNQPLYLGIIAELIDDSHRYLLFNGAWYQVAKQFYDSLEAKIKNVPVYETPLPPLVTELNDKGTIHHEAEGTYNIKLADYVEGGRLFDKVNFNNEKGKMLRGVIEPADVITLKRELFFVKKGDSSAALSHLFLQGLVSAKLLAGDDEGSYRHFLNGLLDPHHEVFSDNVTNAKVTLIFVIIRSTHQLPFFSMISFSEVLDNLREMGYVIKIAWPPMEKLPTAKAIV